jgi:hypothetical protein
MGRRAPEDNVPLDEIDIDWNYLLERLERLLDLGEEYLEERLSAYEPDPELFAKFIAFRWRRHEKEGYLEEVSHPDLPDHADLLRIERALSCLRQNTRQFLHGLPANNMPRHQFLYNADPSPKFRRTRQAPAPQNR